MSALSVSVTGLGVRFRMPRLLVFMLLPALIAGAVLSAWADEAAVDDLVAQAQTALMSGRPADAIPILRKAISAVPDRADLYLMRSRANDSAGKFSAAIEDASKYIELEPDDSYGYLNRARIYMSMDKYPLALQDANKAIELAPNEPDGYFRRADIYYSMNRDADAKADEAKAEELDRLAR